MSFAQRCQSLKEAAQLSLDNQAIEQLSEQILTQVVLETLRTYRKKVAVGIEDSAADLLDKFKNDIATRIFDTAAGWRVVQQDSFLYPKGCRFCFRKGPNTIIVIEQDPQVRTLLFSGGMLRNPDLNRRDSSLPERASLSIPYSIFVFHFQNEGYCSTRYFWRTSPLRSLMDSVYTSVLPNIHNGGQVCTGEIATSQSMSEACETVVSSFWLSQFSSDLSTEWITKDKISPKLATGKIWEQNTEDDPLFILQMPFKLHKPLKEVIDQLGAGEQLSESVFRHKLYEDIESCVEALFHKITQYLKKTKFERHSPSDVKDLVKAHVTGSVTEFSAVLMAVCHELDQLKTDISLPKQVIRPKGELWHEYEEDKPC